MKAFNSHFSNNIHCMRTLGPALLASALLALASCSESNDEEPAQSGSTLVTLRTNVVLNTRTDATPVMALGDGDKMNVYVKSYNSLSSADLISGVSATNSGGNWTMNPELRLADQQTAFIWAFYPWSSANSNPTAIPVDITTQTDYLYSGAYVAATARSNQPTLNMKHALSLLSVKFNADNYSGQGLVTAMELTHPDVIVTKGTLDVSTGRISPSAKGSLKASVNAVVGGPSATMPSMWTVPFSTAKAQVELKLTIDGRQYAATLPIVTMQKGWQYVVHAVLTDNGLAIIPENTQEFQLDAVDAPASQLEGYGRLSFGFSGGNFAFPSFTGGNVFGNVAAGSTTANYKAGGSMNVAGAQTVVIETWNTTGFTIDSFEGIDRIDISQY